MAVEHAETRTHESYKKVPSQRIIKSFGIDNPMRLHLSDPSRALRNCRIHLPSKCLASCAVDGKSDEIPLHDWSRDDGRHSDSRNTPLLWASIPHTVSHLLVPPDPE